jgi:hypothetical protein
MTRSWPLFLVFVTACAQQPQTATKSQAIECVATCQTDADCGWNFHCAPDAPDDIACVGTLYCVPNTAGPPPPPPAYPPCGGECGPQEVCLDSGQCCGPACQCDMAGGYWTGASCVQSGCGSLAALCAGFCAGYGLSCDPYACACV